MLLYPVIAILLSALWFDLYQQVPTADINGRAHDIQILAMIVVDIIGYFVLLFDVLAVLKTKEYWESRQKMSSVSLENICSAFFRMKPLNALAMALFFFAVVPALMLAIGGGKEAYMIISRISMALAAMFAIIFAFNSATYLSKKFKLSAMYIASGQGIAAVLEGV